MDQIKITNSIYSAFVETIVTYPIDFIKTNNQVNKKIDLNFKNSYNGIKYRFIGILPMRFVFWNTMDYCRKNNYNRLTSAFLISFNQTLIDYPMEQIKTQVMVNKKNNIYDCFKQKNLIMSYNTTLVRNFKFMYIFKCVQDNKLVNNDFINNGIGGLTASVLTHPMDTLKTYYQSNTKFDFYKINYMKGVFYRSSIGFLSMSIGYYFFHYF